MAWNKTNQYPQQVMAWAAQRKAGSRGFLILPGSLCTWPCASAWECGDSLLGVCRRELVHWKGGRLGKNSSESTIRWLYFLFLVSMWIVDSVAISYFMQRRHRVRLFGDSTLGKFCFLLHLPHRQRWTVLGKVGSLGNFYWWRTDSCKPPAAPSQPICSHIPVV